MELTDYTIVQNILNGNENDFSLLYNKYKRLVYNEALKYSKDYHELDDISQEVFLRIYKSLSLFNPDYRISTWITRITRNFCITLAKNKKHALESLDDLNHDREGLYNSVTPEKTIVRQESLEQLRFIVMQLPEEYRQPIVLYYFKGHSYKELTEILNSPMSIVKNRIYRAKIKLKKKLLILDEWS